jgi:hypothetical protein
VTACSGYFEGAFDMLLPFDLLKVGLGVDGQLFRLDRFLGRNQVPAGEMPVKLRKGGDRDDLHVGDQGGLCSVRLGDEDAFETLLSGDDGHGEHTSGVAHTTIQR